MAMILLLLNFRREFKKLSGSVWHKFFKGRKYFSEQFKANSVVLVTWDGVENLEGNATNAFQVDP